MTPPTTKRPPQINLQIAPRNTAQRYNIFSQRSKLRVGSDGKVAIGNQRLRVETAPESRVVRCQHPNGDITILKEAPSLDRLPEVLLSTRLC